MVPGLRSPGGPILLGTAFALLASGLGTRAYFQQRGDGHSASARSSLEHSSQLPPEGSSYLKDAIPGGRNVETPYGTIRVYEWGPEEGEKVLLLHGISAPALTVSGLADELALRGYRVLIFDLFGRGYSENLVGPDHDVRLYTTQILLALASSPLPWLGNEAFHLVGYSFGGGLAAAFTRYYPAVVKSVTLIAPCGFVRRTHNGWKQRLLYSTGIFPEWLLQHFVRKRLTPPDSDGRPSSPLTDDGSSSTTPDKRLSNDVTGGDDYDSAGISRFMPGTTVAQTIGWQVSRHPGFIPAFMSSIRYAPIFEQQALWSELGGQLRARKLQADRGGVSPLRGDKILVILGHTDPVIIEEEFRADAKEVLGDDLVEYLVMDAGHEVVMTKAEEIATAAARFWSGQSI